MQGLFTLDHASRAQNHTIYLRYDYAVPEEESSRPESNQIQRPRSSTSRPYNGQAADPGIGRLFTKAV